MKHSCTYCGAWDADTRDHVVPVSYNQIGRKGASYKGTVACCRECNTLLGNRPYFTITSRAAYLLGAYEAKYKKLLKQPSWSEEELEEVGPGIAIAIVHMMKDKVEVSRQLEHLALVAEDHDLDMAS